MKTIALLLLTFGISLHAERSKFNIKSFMDKYCIDCHDEDIQKADRRLDNLSVNIADIDSAHRWQEVLDVLNLDEMPPKKKKQPSKEELFGAINWLTESLKKAETKFNAQASTVTMRRLTQYEYDKTVHNIFKFESKRFTPSRHLPKDDIDHGFKNIGSSQMTSPILLNNALKAADEIVNFAMSKGGEKPETKTVKMPYNSFRVKNGRTSIRIEEGKKCVSLFNCSPKLAKAMSINLKDGVPADGYYDLEIEAEAFGRIHKFPERVFEPMNMDDKFVLQIAAEVYEDTAAGNCQEPGETLNLIEIEDNIRKTYKVRIWLQKGESPSMLFWNGPPMNSNFRAAGMIEKYYPHLFPEHLKGKNLKGRKNKLVPTNAYKGPRIRIWDAKLVGPFYPKWPMPSYVDFFDTGDLKSTLKNAAEKILRRPVTNEEIASLVTRTENYREEFGNLNSALANTYRYLLTHPEFLYLVETKSKNKTLPIHQFASRLSLFLTGRPADHATLNKLSVGIDIPTIVDTLLEENEANYVGRNFADQWLHLHKLGMMPPDKKFKLYHRNYLEDKMKEETQLLIVEAIQKNLTLKEVLTGHSTWVDRSLAVHYGLSTEGLKENEFTKVSHPQNSPRRGILGHSSILTLTSNGVETSPIVRGVWLMENILGIQPPPPPPDVPPIEPDIRGAKTIREQIEKHREVQTCNSCHQKIDPLGFTLEAFDPVGTFREQYPNKKAIDTTAVYRGVKIADALGLVSYLEDNIDQVARCVLEKMVTFSTGRHLNFADQAEIKKTLSTWKDKEYKMRDLVRLVAASSIFQNH